MTLARAARAENVFKNFFKEAATTGKLRVPSVLASDEIPLIAGADVAGAAAAVLQDFDAYAGQVLGRISSCSGLLMLHATTCSVCFCKLVWLPLTPPCWLLRRRCSWWLRCSPLTAWPPSSPRSWASRWEPACHSP